MLLENITEITIYEVQELQTIFIKALSKVESLVVDMSQIKKIDMVGIQLLLSLVNSTKILNKTVSFVNINDSVLEEIRISSCENSLGLANG